MITSNKPHMSQTAIKGVHAVEEKNKVTERGHLDSEVRTASLRM